MDTPAGWLDGPGWIFWLVFIAISLLLVTSSTRRGRNSRLSSDEAIKDLKARYERGEMSQKEYETARSSLEKKNREAA